MFRRQTVQPVQAAKPDPCIDQCLSAADTADIPAAAPPAGSAPATNTAAVAQHVHVAPQDTAAPDVNALAVQIAAKSQSGARQFDIRLDPPELGRVDVRLSIDAGGKAQAHLTADQPSTLSMLQKDAPVLTRALRDAGLDVSQSGLNFSLRGQGSNRLSMRMATAAKAGDASSAPRFQAVASHRCRRDECRWRGPADGRLDIRV